MAIINITDVVDPEVYFEKKKEQQQLLRCTICDHVSSPEIQTNNGEHCKKLFTPDPKDPNKGYICGDCSEWYHEMLRDYQAMDDEKEGWNNNLRTWFENANDNEETE